MRGAALLLPLVLVGCAAGRHDSASGSFEVKSAGRVLSFGELAKQPTGTESATQLALQARGSLVARLTDGTYTLALSGVEAWDVTSGNRRTLFDGPQKWAIRFSRGDAGVAELRADQELGREKLWVTRCLLSYWRLLPPAVGSLQEVELDGRNTVSYKAGGQGVVLRTWTSKADEVADLADLPGREAIPVKAEVGGTIEYAGGPLVTRIEGAKRTHSSVGGRPAGSSLLEVRIEQVGGDHRPTPTP
jgi:hypothetical protein